MLASIQRRRARWGLLAVAVLASLLLVGSALSSYGQARALFGTVARGQAELLVAELHRRVRESPGPPRAELLATMLQELTELGLRYVAVVGPTGAIELEAGATAEPAARLDDGPLRGERLAPVGARLRLVSSARPPRGAAGPRHPPPPRVLLEFEPMLAQALVDRALHGLVIGLAVAMALVVAASVFWRRSRRADAAEARLHRQEHLLAMGEMSAVLAHEIRNPLASLKGHAQLLVEQLPEGERAREKAERMVRETVRLETLVTNLLELARDGRVEREPVAPAEVLEAAVQALGRGDVVVDLEGAPASWPMDAARLQQVLGNLLRNAVQASPEGVPPEVSVRVDGGQLLFQVRDHGAGLPEGDRLRLFDAFYTTRARGTGLGLALARRIVELHGGRIVADNHPDGGAVFRLWLPPA